MHKTSLEITSYVAGAGAFGVFFRWLQTQIAFDEKGLVGKSFCNVLVVLVILAAAFVFLRFVDRFKNRRFYLPEEFKDVFANSGKLFTVARWAIGALMFIGSMALLITCETDKNADFLRVLAALGALTGISFPFILSAPAKEPFRNGLVCLYMFLPIATFAVWLLASYKANDINSVTWAYAVEIISICAAMIAFFRVAGFAFSSPSPWRSMFFAMFGAFMCIMCLADERNIGMQIMFLASAAMLLLYTWIIVSNLKQRDPEVKIPTRDGFDKLR